MPSIVGPTYGNLESDTALLSFGPGSSPEEFAVSTIVVSGTSALRYEAPQSASRGPSVSGVVIHSAPME